MHGLLRSIIREVLEEIEEKDEKELEEFSGVAALGGGPAMPLGVDSHYPNSRVGGKKKKVDEANTTGGAGSGSVIFNDMDTDGDSDPASSKLKRSHDQMYYDSVSALARAFGDSDSPFLSLRSARKHIARKY